jgi:osmotically-inducible protein OsmY
MRAALTLILLLALSGCTALLIGGGGAGGKDQRSTSQVSKDGATTATIRNRLAADAAVSAYNINVATYANRVTLRGTVGSGDARSRAERIAAGVDGVISVRNDIRVENGR